MARSNNVTEPIPGYRNYLVYCDESGQSGKRYYGFGSLWMPWERRGDFRRLFDAILHEHHYTHEVKWNRVNTSTEALSRALIEEFFRRNWLMFHCIIGRKGYLRKNLHRGGYDEALRKQFTLMIRKKIEFFAQGEDPSRVL